MKDQLTERGRRIWQGFQSFTPGQKAVTIAAVMALVIGGYVFSSWASKPTYAPLFTNLSQTDAAAITDKLTASKTPYQLAQGGTEILVAQKDVNQLRLTMSAASLPTAGTSGYSLLDKEGITTSEFKQRIDLQRALEAELNNTIKSISGITDAQTHLAIPEQSVFNDSTQKTTASVLLTTTPGMTLASGQVQAIVNLVASSVSGLAANQVSVSDASGKILSAAGQAIGATGDAQTEQTQTIQNLKAGAIQAMLDKALGVGHSQVTVNADLNFDQQSVNSLTYSSGKNAPNLANSFSYESYGNNGAKATNGVVGATSPSPSVTPGAAAGVTGSPNYIKSAGANNPALNQTSASTIVAPGGIKRLTVAVVLDKNAQAVNTTDINNLVSVAAGLDPTRGDKIQVKTIAFDTSAAAAASSAAAAAALAATKAASGAKLMSMIKTAGLVLVLLVTVIMVMLSNRRRKTNTEPDDLDKFLAQLSTNPGSLPPAPIDIIGPKSDDLQATEEYQRQLATMANEDPDEVARLLRNWLNSKDG